MTKKFDVVSIGTGTGRAGMARKEYLDALQRSGRAALCVLAAQRRTDSGNDEPIRPQREVFNERIP